MCDHDSPSQDVFQVEDEPAGEKRGVPRSDFDEKVDIAIGPRVLAPADKADSTADLWVISLVYIAGPGKEFSDIASVL